MAIRMLTVWMVLLLLISLKATAAKHDISLTDKNKSANPMLTDAQQQQLQTKDWAERVKDQKAVWVSIRMQRFFLIEKDQILWEVSCSTAAKGAGSQKNSFKTPLGWHRVKEKIGHDEPWGRVYRDKAITKGVWHPGEKVREDMVLTRILTLDGEEPGKNKGGDVDSYARCIYIHGTNDEENIGKPTSHGCIRLTNDHIIQAFEMIPEGTPVLITE